MGLASMNKHRPAVLAARLEGGDKEHNFGHGEVRPAPENETLHQRLARYEASTARRRDAVSEAKASAVKALAGLGKITREDEQPGAVHAVKDAKRAVEEAETHLLAAETIEKALRDKLAKPETKMMIGELEALRKALDPKAFEGRLLSHVLPLVVQAFELARTVEAHCNEMVREHSSNGTVFRAVAAELDEYAEPPHVRLDIARRVLGNALHEYADSKGIHQNDHGVAEWLKPCRL